MAIEWALAAALQAASPAPVFAPPVGTPLVLTIEQHREGKGEQTRTTIAERRIVFRRDGAGWRADMTQLAARTTSPTDAFARAVSASMAQPVVFRLDAGGKVTSIDDLAGVWQRLIDAMRTTIGEHAAAPLRALPEAQRQGMLATMLSDAIEARAAGEGPLPEEAVKVPAAPIAGGGAPAMLAGTRSVRREGDALVISTRAKGALSAPAGATASIATDTRLDPRTGLLIERVDDVDATLADGASAHRRTTRTSLRYQDTRQETRRNP